ncbi:hypothetical protein ACFPGO_07510 [Arcanobacterium canis]|uniref:Protein kinase domain-containing protein n=1 Tax=Arcanobacterium canis TaxID=999183 RepID=A0ABY8FY17_9ACTO|nr:hypothetical protein [Arcanobacterium canis]WFM83389.1 hypothetical protein P7079_08385 [Arcanobacterium canis]
MSKEFVQPGDRIAERFDLVYPIEHSLGSRDGVNVWIARDTILSRSLRAILIRHDCSHASEVADAARRIALISDPHLVSTISVIDTDSLTAIFTEVPPGIPFTSYLGGDPIDPHIVWALVGEVATTVNNIRHRGVRHLCLDASDILIQDTSGVVVDGFGIQAALNDEDISLPWEDLDARETTGLIQLTAALLLGRDVDDPQVSIERALDIDGLPEPLRAVLSSSGDDKTPADFVRTIVPWPELDTSSLQVINEPADAGSRRPVPPATSADADRRPFNVSHVAFPPVRQQAEPQQDDTAVQPESLSENAQAMKPASSKAEAAQVVEKTLGIEEHNGVSNVQWPKPSADPFVASAIHAPGAAANIDSIAAIGADPNFAQPIEVPDELAPESVFAHADADTDSNAGGDTDTGEVNATDADRVNTSSEPGSDAGDSLEAPTAVVPVVKEHVEQETSSPQESPVHNTVVTPPPRRHSTLPTHPSEGVTRTSAFAPTRSGHGPTHGVIAGAGNSNGELVAPRKFNPSKVVVSVFAIGVVVAGVWSLSSLFRPLDPVQPSSSASYLDLSTSTGGATDQSRQSPTSETSAPPKIASADVITLGIENFRDAPKTNVNNVEGIQAAIDSKPETSWRSWWFSSQEMKPADSTVIVLKLAEKATISEVTLKEAGRGGNIEWRNTVPEKATEGEAVAQGELSGDTTLKAKDPVNTDTVVLRVTKLPVGTDGKFRLNISEITLK